MTLDTRVIITSPVEQPREAFDFCRALLGATDRHPFDPIDGTRSGNPGWCNKPGIGLPAWLFLWYGADGPLVRRDCYCEELVGLGDGGECSACREPVGFVEVSFDTSYGYRKDGEGCGDLHARLVHALGRWCDERGLNWSWHNEFTGEWHEKYEGLHELGRAGGNAEAWLRDVVEPAIARGALS